MKLSKKRQAYSILLISYIVISLLSSLNHSIPYFKFKQRVVKKLNVSNSNKIFDGMYINYASTFGGESSSQFNYSHIADDKFHTDWIIDDYGSISHMYWDVNTSTRVIENSGGDAWQFGNGNHTPVWIITDVSISTQVLIAVDGEGDHVFEVTSDLIYEIPAIGPVEVWILEDLTISGGIAWYEKSTGILLNGTFLYNGGSNNYKFEFIDTNIRFNFTHDYELGVFLEIPALCEVGVTHQFNITVINYGLKDVFNVNISLYLNGFTINSFTISNLQSNSSEIIIDNWTPYEYGVYNFTAYIPPIQEEPFLDNNYATKIIYLPSTLLFDGMYIEGWVMDNRDFLMPSNVTYTHYSDNIFSVSLDINMGETNDYWHVDSRTRKISASYFYNNNHHTPYWIFINVSLGDNVLICVPHGNDHTFTVLKELMYELPGYGTVEVWELHEISYPNGILWYEKSTGIMLNGTLYSSDGTNYFKFYFRESNAEFSYVQPPNSFELSTDANTPSDSDGMFNLTWTVADGALSYNVYEYSSYITEINDTLITLIENTTDHQLNLDGYSNGTYYFIAVAKNKFGETLSNCIKIEVAMQLEPDPDPEPEPEPEPQPEPQPGSLLVPGYNVIFLIIYILSISIIILKKRKKFSLIY